MQPNSEGGRRTAWVMVRTAERLQLIGGLADAVAARIRPGQRADLRGSIARRSNDSSERGGRTRGASLTSRAPRSSGCLVLAFLRLLCALICLRLFPTGRGLAVPAQARSDPHYWQLHIAGLSLELPEA